MSLNISLHFHTSLSNKASGHNTHFLHSPYITPHISIGALDSVKIFQSHFLFLNLSQYKPCSKCYEKMYMFIQGRLWQDTGFSLHGWPQEWAGVSDAWASVSSHHPFPPSPPGTSSAPPLSECTHTPCFLGKQLVDLCHCPHTPGGRSRDQPGSLPCNCSPSGPDQRDAALQGRVRELSAHHVIAIHSISGILHRIVDFSTECWQVLREPVSVFRQKIPLNAFHQIFKTQMHGLLFLWWLAIDNAVS